MKIGEWDNLGRARGLLQRQLGDLNATEYAAHVTVKADSGRLRIFVATDIGLLDYQYAPVGADPEGAWILRGQLIRWGSVRALRLQTDAQLDEAADTTQMSTEAGETRTASSGKAAPTEKVAADVKAA